MLYFSSSWIHPFKVITKKITNTLFVLIMLYQNEKLPLIWDSWEKRCMKCRSSTKHCVCAVGGDQQRHSRDLAMHRVRVWSVHQRARSPASHLQTSERLRDRQTDNDPPPGLLKGSRGHAGHRTPPRHKQRICRNLNVMTFGFILLYNENQMHEKVLWFFFISSHFSP